MLEGLDKIDWSKLRHAYGSAEDVPGLIRQLVSPDEEERSEAMFALQSGIWHQGTVYEATSHAVPFLIELLEAPEIADKDKILVYLSYLAAGSSYCLAHQPLEHMKPEAVTPAWGEQLRKELEWVANTKAAVRAGAETYFGLLSHAESSVREAAAFLLASFDRPAPAIVDRLWKQFERESHETVKASCLLTIGELAEKNDSNCSLLLHAFTSLKNELTRRAAAFALVRMVPDRMPADAMAALRRSLDPDGHEALEELSLIAVPGAEMFLGDRFALLEGDSAVEMMLALASSLDAGVKHPRALVDARVLLAMLFPKPLPGDATLESLTENQRQALRTLAKNRDVWVAAVSGEPAETFQNTLLARAYGLDDKLKKMLEAAAVEAGSFKLTLKEKRTSLAQKFRRLISGRFISE